MIIAEYLGKPQVAKANAEHKKNVWEMIQCPEYALNAIKEFTWVSFSCVLGELVVIKRDIFGLRALWVISFIKDVKHDYHPERFQPKSRSIANHH